MASLDVGKAAFAGFGVIARNPLAVLAWGLLLLVIGVLPAGLFIGPMFELIHDMSKMSPQELEAMNGDPDAMLPFMSMMIVAQPLIMLSSLVTRTLITAAVFRAVLLPAEKGWFYLRLGARELWLGLTMIVFGLLAGMAGFGVWLLVAPAFLIAAVTGQDNVGMVAAVLLPLACIGAGVVIWLILRFSMGLPMSFAEKNFRLFESWKMTKGHGGELFLIGLLLTAILVALELLLLGLLIALFAGAVGLNADLFAGLESNEDPMLALRMIAPWIAGLGVVACFVGAAVMAIVTAPWAEAYRQLTVKAEPTAA